MLRAAANSIAHFIGRTVNVLIVLIVWHANGLSTELAQVLLLLAALVDTVRFVATRHGWGDIDALEPLENPLADALTRPAFSLYMLVGLSVVLLLAYKLFPDICLPDVNKFVSDNFGLANRRIEHLGGACNVPHGTVLLLSQAALILFLLLSIAQLSLSEALNVKRFYLKKVNPPSPYKISLGYVFLVIFIYIHIFLPFDSDQDIHRTARLFKPQYNLFQFMWYAFCVLIPVLLFRPFHFSYLLSAMSTRGGK